MTSNPLVADFETVNDPQDCRVWAWAIADVSHEPTASYGTDLSSFIDSISEFDFEVWFHNLAFDGSFIIDFIMRQGYVWVKENPRPGQLTTLISMMGKFYSIQVHWKNGNETHFKDSLKKIPMSVKEVGPTYGMPETKGDLDYNKPRPVGYEPTADEWDYITRDVVIVAKALAIQLDAGLKKLTVGSDALTEFRSVFGSRRFNKYFPLLSDEMDSTIRTAYRGGWTYCDSRSSGRRVGKGQTLDVNSLYPYIMKTAKLPYGLPRWFEGPPDESQGIYIVSVTITGKLRKNHLPMIQAKKSMFYKPTDYLTDIDEPITMSVTNVDWQLMNEHYDLTVWTYNGGLYFKSSYGFFDEYVTKWSTVKEQSKGGMRAIAKLFLNSLYGKFGTNPDVTGKYPIFEDDQVKLRKGDDDMREPVYTAMAVFITSYARELTIRAAQKNYKYFAYADTDSIHLLTQDDPIDIDVHPTSLGAWKREYYFDDAVFLRAKQYGELKADGSHEIHIAAVPRQLTEKMTLDDLYTGNIIHGKLASKRVPGGIVLSETTFTIQ